MICTVSEGPSSHPSADGLLALSASDAGSALGTTGGMHAVYVKCVGARWRLSEAKGRMRILDPCGPWTLDCLHEPPAAEVLLVQRRQCG